MNFNFLYTWLKDNLTLPSFLFKNRIFVIYIKNIKRIFNFLGFSYKNNLWYTEKFNNVLNLFSVKRLFIGITSFLLIVSWMRVVNFKFDLITIHLINIIDTVELFLSCFVFILYWIYLYIKLVTVSRFSTTDVKKLTLDTTTVYEKLSTNEYIKSVELTQPVDVNTLYSTFDNKSSIKLLYLCNLNWYNTVFASSKPKNLFLFLVKPEDTFTNNTQITGISNINNIIFNDLYKIYGLKTQPISQMNMFKYDYIKSIKYVKWLFNYTGSNKTNYNYLYALNSYSMGFENSGLSNFKKKLSSSLLISTEKPYLTSSWFMNFYIKNAKFVSSNNFFILNRFNSLSQLNSTHVELKKQPTSFKFVENYKLINNDLALINLTQFGYDNYIKNYNLHVQKLYMFTIVKTTNHTQNKEKIKKMFFFK